MRFGPPDEIARGELFLAATEPLEAEMLFRIKDQLSTLKGAAELLHVLRLLKIEPPRLEMPECPVSLRNAATGGNHVH